MQLNEVLKREVETVGPDTPVRQVACRMRDRGVGFMPVVDQGTLVGVITDRDITVRSVAASMDADTTPVREIMSVQVVCCFEDEDAEHARTMMTEHTVRRLLVISRKHALVGIVTLPDVGGIEPPRKKSVKVTFHKEKTDSYGRPHKVEVKTVYITSVRGKEAAEAAAVKHVEQEAGTAWTNVATGFESREEPDGKSPPSG